MNVEDAITIAQFLLEYIGFDVEDWSIPRNWREWRSDIRHRSLVRIIGTYYSNAKVRRINFQAHMIGRETHEMDSIFYMSSDSILETADGKVWVEDDLGDGVVEIRAQNCDALFGNTIDTENEILHHKPTRTSTPFINQSLLSMTSHDPDATAKITVLEEELARLREQIAMVVLAQEQASVLRPQQDDATLNETYTVTSAQPDLVKCVPQHTEPPLPPPVVPPPPPPLEITQPKHITLDNNREDHSKAPMLVQKASDQPITMGDVLKNIHNVKLKAVERSPGGTPLRRKPRESQSNDPATLIASALKKKFANRRVLLASPLTDKENSSPECSPATLASDEHSWKARRSKRLSVFNEDGGKSSSSPLAHPR